jgi:PKD repeat protein
VATYVTTGLLNGQTVTVKVTNAAGCSTTSTGITTTVNPIPVIDFINNIVGVCSGVSVGPIGLSASTGGGETFSWSGGSTIGLTDGSDGTAPFEIPSFVSSNTGSTVQTATITLSAIKDGCVSSNRTFTISINPIPSILATPSNQAICSGTTTSIVLSNPNGVSGTTYSWTVSATNVTGATSGGGSSIVQYLTSTDGVNPGTVTYTVTPSANGCADTAIPVTITVNPAPTFTVSNSAPAICSGGQADITLNTPTANGIITLTNVNYNGVTGTLTAPVNYTDGQQITEVLTNSTNTPITVIYTFSVAANGCSNPTSQQASIIVNPAPSMSIVNASSTICSNSLVNILLNSSTSGAIITLTGINYNGVVGTLTSPRAYNPGSVINEALINNTSNTITVTYSFTVAGNGCSNSTVFTTTVDVKPIPVITNTPLQLQQNVCSGTALNFLPTSTTDPGTTYTWSSSTSGSFTGITSNGSGTINDTPVNTANTVGYITYTITPQINGCSGAPVNYVVTVNPIPTANGSDLTICSGQNAIISINASPANVVGTTFSWVAIPTPNVTGSVSDNGSTINQILTLTDFSVGTVTYQVTPSVNGCNGPVKNIIVTVNPIPTVDAGVDYEVCEPLSIPVTGIIGGAATSGSWVIVSGAGSISASTISGNQVTATYTVAPSDVASSIVLRLDTDDPAGPCSAVSDLLQIQIRRRPAVTLPADYIVCEPTNLVTSPINLSGTIGGSAISATWSIVSGAGTLSASTLTGSNVISQYTIDPMDVGNTITLRLTSNDPDGICSSEFDEINITINRAAIISAGPDLQQCEDSPSIVLQGTQAGAITPVTWSGGSGSFSNSTLLQPTYSFNNPAEVNSTITLTITTLDPDGTGPCLAVSDQMRLIVNPLPAVVFSGLPSGTPAQLVENSPPITLTGNNVGGLFTISPSSSVIGSTTVNIVDRVVFDPSAVELGANFITYTFTNANGCTNFDTQEIFINPVTTIDFGVQGALVNADGEFELCADLGDVKLLGFPPPSDGFPPETKFSSEGSNAADLVVVNIGADYYIKTDGVASAVYRIRYTFKNQFGAITFKEKSIRIFASPIPQFTSANNCIESDVIFTDTSGINPSPFPATITNWQWDFDDGDISYDRNPSKGYQSSGTYDVTLRVITSQGCSSTSAPYSLRVGDVPVVDFSWSSICNNDQTKFKDKTDPGPVSTIASYNWDFGDGNFSTLPDPEYKYTSFGTYDVTLSVLTNDGCDNSLTKRVFILPYNTVTPKADEVYLEDFESSNGGWIAEAFDATNSTPTNVIRSDTSWIWGMPTGVSIATAAGGSNVWWTGRNANTYFSNENSVVNGPCFDLSQLQRPMVALDYFSDTETNLDGAVLQYSIDGGITWAIVGPTPGVPNRDEGINWFNGVGIFSNPGSQPIGPALLSYGWTSKQQTWKNARFKLDLIPKANRGQVRLRIAFASNDGNASGTTFDGFAFDNFFVGDKTRNVLVEHFTTYTLNASLVEDAYLNNLLESQITFDHPVSDFNNIQYHVNFGGVDSLNRYNPTDPAARGLYYGVSQPPFTVMDGLTTGKFSGETREITTIEIDRRALVDPKFILTLETLPTSNSRTMSVRLTLKAAHDINVPLVAQVALLENDVIVQDVSTTFRNVLRKQLFASDGETINNSFIKDQVTQIIKEDIELDIPINNPDKLFMIGFVLDKNSKEIYQSIVVKAPPKNGAPIVGVKDNDPVMIANLNTIQVYPNPANNEFNFAIPGDVLAETQWNIIDQRGVSVLRGDFTRMANGLLPVDVSSLPNAVYYVLINGNNGAVVRKKLVVMNRN